MADKLRFVRRILVRYCPWERNSTSAREFLHWCQLNKTVQKLEDCSVKAELIQSDFTPSAKVEYVNGQFEELSHKMYTSRMIDHVLSQCRLVSEGKRIWEEEDWDKYSDYVRGEGGVYHSRDFDRDLLDLVVMGEDFPNDADGGKSGPGEEGEEG